MDRGRETKIGRWGEREGGGETEGRREAGREETQGARTEPSPVAASGRCLPLCTSASHLLSVALTWCRCCVLDFVSDYNALDTRETI